MGPEKRKVHNLLCFHNPDTLHRGGELKRLDFILVALGILLAVAMVLTLLYGKKHSRHGYGQILSTEQELLCVVAGSRDPVTPGPFHYSPRRIG
jgi:hypothetical protein